ncbi:hypothetical protein V8C86DRAFT_237110 [Haematococcus lacustris]
MRQRAHYILMVDDDERLAACIAADVQGADVLISAFSASLLHYRRANVAKPFPTALFPGDHPGAKDFAACMRAVAQLPCVADLQTKEQLAALPTQTLQLLHWLFLPRTRRRVQLESISASQLVADMQAVQSTPPPLHITAPDQTPIAILRIIKHSDPATQQQSPSHSSLPPHTGSAVQSATQAAAAAAAAAADMAAEAGLPQPCQPCSSAHHNHAAMAWATPPQLGSQQVLAFHGSCMEAIHSILHTGLQNMSHTQLMRHGAAFGTGIYLSDNCRVAQDFSSAQPTWRHTQLADRLHCVLVCQVDLDKLAQLPAIAAHISRLQLEDTTAPGTGTAAAATAATTLSPAQTPPPRAQSVAEATDVLHSSAAGRGRAGADEGGVCAAPAAARQPGSDLVWRAVRQHMREGGVPDNYLVVERPDAIRLLHLLVYGRRQVQAGPDSSSPSRRVSLALVLVLGYALLMCLPLALGVWRGPVMRQARLLLQGLLGPVACMVPGLGGSGCVEEEGGVDWGRKVGGSRDL